MTRVAAGLWLLAALLAAVAAVALSRPPFLALALGFGLVGWGLAEVGRAEGGAEPDGR